MFYRSERLFLRPPFPEDARGLYEGICDAGVVAMLGSAPWPYRMEDAERSTSQLKPGLERFLITLPAEDGRIIGGIGFNSSKDDPEIGYWIARSHWGRGYGTEAVRAVCEMARAFGHARLTAGHYLDNPASGRVLRKVGFRETGEIRPTECRARGGELVLSRRYALELEDVEGEVGAAQMRAA
jgi:RimJ/RimL family protein N-acetyltransferase